MKDLCENQRETQSSRKKKNSAVIIAAHYFVFRPDLSQGYFLELNINGLRLFYAKEILNNSVHKEGH